MADTKKSLTDLQTLLADNTTGNISPQDLRDFLISVHADINYGGDNHLTAEEINQAIGKVKTNVGMAYEPTGDWKAEEDAIRSDANMYSPNPVMAQRHFAYTFRGKYHRTYFCWMASLANDLGTYVNYYDHDTNAFGTAVSWGIPLSGATDVHCYPTIFVAPDGHIIVIQEQLSGTSSSAHNSPHHVRISDSPEDISAWTAIANSPIGDDMSYPNIVQIPSGKLFWGTRYGYYDTIGIMKSDDYGRIWKKLDDTVMDGTGKVPTILLDMDETAFWAYNSFFTLKDGICCLLRGQCQSCNKSYPNGFALFSFDGDTWGNWTFYQSMGTEGWSKDIVTDGAITQTEMLTNFHISGTGVLTSNYNMNGHITNFAITNEYLCFLEPEGSRSTGSSVYTDWYFTRVYKDGTIEQKSFIDNSDFADPTYLDYAASWIIPLSNNGMEFDLFVANQNSGYVERYRTRNAGDDWLKMTDPTTTSGIYTQGMRGSPFYNTGTFVIVISERTNDDVLFLSFRYEN